MMNAKTHTILIVDDVATNLDLLSSLLIDKYNVKVAKNGPMAINIAQKNANLDLILLDVMMPGMDGFQVCEQLKSDPKTKEIPIIFLTAKTETEDIVAGFEAGSVDYLTKPFNPHELLARVNTQILIKQQKDMIIKQNREQKEMLHILSHDLANHFGVILFALELSKINSGKSAEYHLKIKNATSHGIDIINLVREMRSLEEKHLKLARVNLFKMVSESVKLLTDRYQEKNISIKIDIDETIFVVAEKRSLVNSVINNILTNAHKFSFENSSVEISAIADAGKAELIIEDHGIGIPHKILENLFDINECISRTGTNGETGTGFGMSLIKSFIEHYGGEIKVSSRDIQDYPDDHGTKVSIYFHIAEPKI